ncbi:MAG: PHP domain-containing protein [Ignavibacteriales bacterium]|nr:PHP domain-containing protein [Ignavibacteriales bacterium]MCF8435525.1 PHP domain-containing protein [Ignavibacteriales bacterium]
MVSLHTHSFYSKLNGTLSIEEIVSHAKVSESRYAALTDTNGMYGWIQFAGKAVAEGIKPVFGSVLDDPADNDLSALFLAKNNEGYSELCRLITSRKLNPEFNLRETVQRSGENLFIICNSQKLLESIELTIPLRKNLFAELISSNIQKSKSRKLYEFARQKNIQIVATHPAYFARPDDFELHRVVTAIRENTTLANLNEDQTADPEFWLQPAGTLRKTWRNMPEAIWNAEKIAEECNVDLKLGEYKFPSFPLPYGETSFSYLWKICFRGLEERYQPITDQAVRRLQYELEVIDELGFCDYFLVVWDIVREARIRNMMNIGRGSAANSLVAYCLGFTQVDPLKHNLYFERFLNRGRTSPPDVDLDFSWKERDEIVRYVFDKYGYNRVAMICTNVTFRARSAFRETAKVFGIPESEISKYSKFIPWTSASNLPVLSEKFPEAKSLKFEQEPWNHIIRIASRLAGFPRHLSIHPGGIIITEKPITDYVALEYVSNKGLGLIVTQSDMYPIEEMGLIKIDLLSQRSLGVLRDTMHKIKAESGSQQKPAFNPPIFELNVSGSRKSEGDNS